MGSSCFGFDATRHDGLQSYCKDCKSISDLLYNRTKKGLVSQIYGHQKKHSKIREHGQPKYTKVELQEWLFTQTNFDELYEAWINSGYLKNLIPSVDRLDDYKGYSLTNIQLTTWEENKKRGHEDRKNGVNNKNSKTVLQYTKEEVFISEYYSAHQAGRETSIHITSIAACARGVIKSAGGYIWKYERIAE